jgi:hypothetical protein
MRRTRAAAVAVLASAFGCASCGGTELTAAGYTFSDELGGFRLLSASGSGTRDDPVVIAEELFEAAPVTLVIRNRNLGSGGFDSVRAQLTIVKRVANRSNRVWAAFEMELQEIPKKPSVYSDGLSFKQFAALPPDVSSDSFSRNERSFEPYDRIEFFDGHVDPEATAEFKITITDPTPTPVFYLVQDPKLLAAELPRGGGSFASLSGRDAREAAAPSPRGADPSRY